MNNLSRKYLITKFACSICGSNLSISYRSEEHKPKGSHENGQPTGADMVQQIVIVEPCKCVTNRLEEIKRATRTLFEELKP